MISENYTCRKGHKWSCGWSESIAPEDRRDCCYKCMNKKDFTSYLPIIVTGGMAEEGNVIDMNAYMIRKVEDALYRQAMSLIEGLETIGNKVEPTDEKR